MEPAHLSPVFPVGLRSAVRTPPTPQQLQEQEAKDAALAKWRLSVPMSYFAGIRSTFEKQGLKIRAYSARFGRSEIEVDRLFLMAKALGVDSIVARVPEGSTSVVASAADRHRMIVGLQFSDEKMLSTQLAASHYFRMDPDIGDLTKGKIDALQFVKANYKFMCAIDLKDALMGGPSVAFGEGNSHMGEVLQFLEGKHMPLTAYVDCDYAGTGRSTDEITRCVSYVRKFIR